MYKLTILFVFCLLALSNVEARPKKKAKPNCDVLKGEAEKCIMNMYTKYFGKDSPKTEEELQAACVDSKILMDCAKKYKPCVRLIAGTIYSVALRTSKKMFKKICDTPSGRRDLLNHIKCFDTPENKEKGEIEMKKMVALVKYSAKLDAKDLLPAGCCVGHWSRAQSEEWLGSEKVKQCQNGTDFMEYMREMAMPNMNDMGPLICQKFNTLEDCQTNAPELMAKIVEITSPPLDIDIEKESLIQPLMDLIERLSRELEKGEFE